MDTTAEAVAMIRDAAQRAARWGNGAYIASVYEALDLGEGYSLDEFKALLWALHKAGALRLRGADLVEAMDASLLAASRIDGPARSTWHFVQLA